MESPPENCGHSGSEVAPKSLFTMEERRRSKRFPVYLEERVNFKAFDGLFSIPKQCSSWLFDSDNKIQKAREHWSPNEQQSELFETQQRRIAAVFILRVGQDLCVVQQCIDAAIVLMHRFYMFHPIRMFPVDITAAAALYLGCKSENHPRRVERIIEKMMDIYPEPSYSDDKLFTDEVLSVENFMSATLGLDFNTRLPTKYINDSCKIFNIDKAPDHLKTSIDYVASNSLVLTNFCLRYPPKLIAAFCIYFASQWAHYDVGISREGKPWYLYIDPNIRLQMLHAMKEEFLACCQDAPRNLVESLKFRQSSGSASTGASFEVNKQRTSEVSPPLSSTHSDDSCDSTNSNREKFEVERPVVNRNERSFAQRPAENSQQIAPRNGFQKLYQHFKQSPPHQPAAPTKNEAPSVSSNAVRAKSLERIKSDQSLQTSKIAQILREGDCKLKRLPTIELLRPPAKITAMPNAAKITGLPNPAKRQKTSHTSLTHSSSDKFSTSKGIRSTVPLKIKPRKISEKDEGIGMSGDKPIIDEYSGCSSVKTKKRISHFNRNFSDQESSSESQHLQNVAEPEMSNFGCAEVVVESSPSVIASPPIVNPEAQPTAPSKPVAIGMPKKNGKLEKPKKIDKLEKPKKIDKVEKPKKIGMVDKPKTNGKIEKTKTNGKIEKTKTNGKSEKSAVENGHKKSKKKHKHESKAKNGGDFIPDMKPALPSLKILIKRTQSGDGGPSYMVQNL